MKRRICGAVLLLVLLCAMTLPAAAAGTSLRLEGPETLPAEGESFTLRLTIQGNPGLCAAQYTLRYDRTLLTCTGASVGSVLKGTLAAVNPEAEDGVITAAASVDPAKGDGSIGEFTFRVLKAGTVRFTLADVSLTDGENQALTLDLPSLTLSPAGSSAGETTAPAPRFTDVPEGYWSHAQIERAAELGLISGYADGSFHPGASVTRAQFVTMLWRLAGKPAAAAEPGFTDLAGCNSDFRAAIAWAAEKGITTGVTATAFQPDRAIDRQQAMAILFRYSGGVSGMESLLTGVYDSQFKDSGDIAPSLKPGVYWAVYQGVVGGVTQDTLAPRSTATRAQIAVILVRFAEKMQ